ncbi:GNAT family N-acetyltransferase [Saccharopolyspora sp. K220]|nr:GNAT family N-acetyltransferase [Saccharopolyspora soli]
MSDVDAHYAGEDDEIVRWLSGGPSTRDTVAAYIHGCIFQWATDGALRAFGIHEVAADVLVGTVDLRVHEPYLAGDQANLAYGIYPAWRRRGLAVRAVRLACAYVHHTGLASEVVIRTHPDNHASAAVARRAGFRFSHREHDRTEPLDWYVRMPD